MSLEGVKQPPLPKTSFVDVIMSKWLEIPSISDGESPDFNVFAHHFSHWAARTTLVVVTFLIILFWPTDFFLFEAGSALRETFFQWRVGMVAIGLASYLGMRHFQTHKLNSIPLTIIYYYALTALTFFMMGTIDNTAFYLLAGTIIPPLSSALLMPLLQRTLVVIGNCAIIWFCYALAQQGQWGEDFFKEAATILLISSCIFTTASGHVIYLLSRKTFYLNQRFKRLANTDPLTGVQNRRSFMEDANKEVLRARRYHHDIGVLMIDVDCFKSINDRFGHQVGDRVLKELSRRIAENLRDVDILGRVGGEEFAVIMPETDLAGSRDAADRIRAAIEQAHLTHSETSPTVSIGCACLSLDDVDIQAPIRRADIALYAAKEAGRNRVCVQGP